MKLKTNLFFVNFINFEHISHVFLMFLLLTLSMYLFAKVRLKLILFSGVSFLKSYWNRFLQVFFKYRIIFLINSLLKGYLRYKTIFCYKVAFDV